MKKKLRIVFMGTPEFAVASLEALLAAGFEIAAVVTAPDKPAGRGKKLMLPAVKVAAIRHGLRVLQPERLKAQDFVETFGKLQTDLGVVVAFRMLPQVLWAMPRLGTFNLHASLLPDYRELLLSITQSSMAKRKPALLPFSCSTTLILATSFFRIKCPLELPRVPASFTTG